MVPPKVLTLFFHINFPFFFFLINFGFLFDFVVVAGTRFRPLSFNTPKPLFPLAGQPMVHHPISACKRVSFSFLFFEFLNFPISLCLVTERIVEEKSYLYGILAFYLLKGIMEFLILEIRVICLLN